VPMTRAPARQIILVISDFVRIPYPPFRKIRWDS